MVALERNNVFPSIFIHTFPPLSSSLPAIYPNILLVFLIRSFNSCYDVLGLIPQLSIDYRLLLRNFQRNFKKLNIFLLFSSFYLLTVSLIQNFYKTFPSTTYCTVLSFIRRINKIQQFNETTMKKIITVQAFI